MASKQQASRQQSQPGRDRPGGHRGPALPDIASLVDDAGRAAAEGAYVAVGLGVLGVQRALVRRRQLRKAIAPVVPARLEDLRRAVAANADATRAQLCSRLRTAKGLD